MLAAIFPMNDLALLQQVFESSPNAYMILDSQLRLVAANHAYLALSGSRLEEVRGKSIFEAFPHDAAHPENETVRRLRASFLRVLQTGERDDIALIHYRLARHPDGPLEDRYWSATHTPIFGAHDKVELILQHTVDVTDLERLKAAAGRHTPVPVLAQMEAGILSRARLVQETNVTLGEEIERLRSIYEQAPGFTCILQGPEHVFELANAAYRKLVGDRLVQGKTVREALPELEGQGFFELLDRVYATGEPFVGSAMTILLQASPDVPPREAILDFVYQPVIDAAGKVVGIFVQGNDITEQRQMQLERERLAEERGVLLSAERAARAEAERANRLKDEFLATVSHELRTPLTAIIGWLQLFRTRQLTTERQERALDTVERNAKALAQLVEDILDVSRIMSGKMQLEVEPVRVMEPTEAAIDAVRPAAEAKGIRIHATLDSTALVMSDPGRLQQIVWNLLANSVKFTAKGGRVHVLVERRESSIAISVRDNGIGIAPEFLPHVFERFRQAEGSSTRIYGGLGLGLAIVKHLVELHGGTITAESDGLDKGALFVVELPVALTRQSPRPAVLDEGLECPEELRGLRILVVEDDADTRELLCNILTGCGAVVDAAPCAAEALESMRLTPPDILLSDIGMPGEDGYSFIRRVRALPEEHGGRVPAIALTAFARTEDRTATLRAGFRAHVPKPIDISELLAVIASLAPDRR